MSERIIIAGRPNVGKSALFNRIVSSRRALVSDVAGTTVDYVETPVEWNGKNFILADTGGWHPSPADPVHKKMRDMLERLAADAAAVILVADAKDGLTPTDKTFSAVLRKLNPRVILAVNKSDTDSRAAVAAEFYSLGFGDPVAVSAVTGRNVDALLDRAANFVTPSPPPAAFAEPTLRPKVIILGRPNAGKSTLLNFLVGKERSIVDPRPGTTRESVDAAVNNKGREMLLVDTPGMARRRKFTRTLDYLSYVSLNKYIDKADVAVLLVDAIEGITKADESLAGLVGEARKACVVAFNKWDAVGGREDRFKILREEFGRRFNFLAYAGFVSISAKTGLRLDSLVDGIFAACAAYNYTFDSKKLGETLREAIYSKPLISGSLKLSFKGVTSVASHPPSAGVVVNEPSIVNFSYRRYLLNKIRSNFPLAGSPVILAFRKENKR